MKRFLAACAAVIAIAGCGGGHHHVTVRAQQRPNLATLCPGGKSYLGCATALHPTVRPSPAAAPGGPKFPDDSQWQGHPNWAAAKPFIGGAYVKASEFTEDPDFAWNVAQLKHLGVRWGAYDFVRSCSASAFIAALRSVGGPSSLPPIFDMEVPTAAGCAPSLERQLLAAFHRVAAIYTAPGTWPGGSNAGLALWEATYGSSFNPVWRPVVAWQFTDGQFGSPVFIPGIGRGDVSVSFGLLNDLPAPPPAPKPNQSSAELQLSNSLNGTATVRVTKGHWTINGRGWRIRSLPLNAAPLGH